MASIFTKIINRDIPGYIVAEDKHHIAFLDINPIALGHTLVVPKTEVDYIFNLEEDQYQALHSFSRLVAKALDKVVPCERVGIAVVGLEVPHAHIHLIPVNEVNDINFGKPKLELSKNEFIELTEKISKAVEQIQAS
jgi:histidine triad (HIT) family protein